MDPVCIPSFTEVSIDGVPRTAISLRVEDRNRGAATHPEVIDLRAHVVEAPAVLPEDPEAAADPQQPRGAMTG